LAYETKAILAAVGRMIKIRAETGQDRDTCETIYNDVAKVANAEGIVLEPFDQDAKEASNTTGG